MRNRVDRIVHSVCDKKLLFIPFTVTIKTLKMDNSSENYMIKWYFIV